MNEKIWVLIGFSANGFYILRWISQYIATVRKKETTVPLSFWIFSLLGALTLLSYSIYRKDPVFIISTILGLVIYTTNLYFMKKK